MSFTITNTSTVQRNMDIVEANIDGETVMMSIENGEYYGLDAIASRIWTIIESPVTVQAINETLLTEYDVSEEQCRDDVVIFLSKMAENNIISVKD